MRFFIHSLSGAGTGLASRIADEGNDVCIYYKKEYARKSLKGMVEHVSSVEEGINTNPDVVLFDMSESGDLADKLRKQGRRVIGAGKLCDLLELDRTYAMNIAKRVGMKIPDYKTYNKNQVDQAIKDIEMTQGRYVLKPHGNMNLDMTYVSHDSEDMIQQLEWIKQKKILRGDFILQEFIKGVEISTEVWFSDGQPVPLANSTIEVKKFLTGEIGPATGCESSVVWPYANDQAKIVDKTIKKMYPIIQKYGYTGPIDVNSIVDEKGDAYFLEFTPRFGYSAVYALCELIEGDLGEFFYNLSTRRTMEMELEDKVSMALTISIPPYPLDPDKDHNRKAIDLTQGKKLFELPENHYWPADVMLEDGQLVTSGVDGIIGYITSKGNSVEEAEDNLYGMVGDIEVSDVQYRVDGGERAMIDIPKLDDRDFDVPYCKRDDYTLSGEEEEEKLDEEDDE